jgi:phenylpropionate dioxygenase-like ring-hydroxylating dioxygenase large terminal subunit
MQHSVGGGLPPQAYTDPDFLALEQQRIFAEGWVCVGRADTLRDPGDYFATSVAKEPVIVLRTDTGDIQALSNVCRHRMSLLLEGRGNVSRIICPYHAWTYSLDGRLRGAPAMEQSESFNAKTICLPSVRCEIWEGWMFLSLNSEAPALDSLFREAATLVADWGMADYVETFCEEQRWHGNWKQVAENFMESYHLPICHAGTVGGGVNLRQLAPSVLHKQFNYHCVVGDGSRRLTTAHPENTRLCGEQRYTTLVMALYPSLMITLSPGYFWYLCVTPSGVSSSEVIFGGGMAPEFAADPDAQALLEETRALTSAILAEDRICVERVCRGTQARLAKGGPLSHLEVGNQGFARWVIDQTGGRVLG